MMVPAHRGPLRLLFAVQGVAAVGMAAGGTAGSLLAHELTGNIAVAELPLAMLVVGATIAVPPVSAAMQRWGRREGLLVGLALAVLGAVVVVMGAAYRELTPVLIGNALLGAGNTAVMFGRYAAADLVQAEAGSDGDLADERSRRAARAVGAALTAAAVGAVLGPNLLGSTGGAAIGLGLPAPAGLYLLAILAFATAAVLALFLPRPPRVPHTPVPHPGPEGRAGDWRRLSPVVLLVLGGANATMVTLMAVAPLQLHAHHGLSLDAVGLAVSLHVAAMFGASPVSGWLCTRIPTRAVAAAGAGLSALTAIGIALLAERHGHAIPFVMVLAVLGLAWNMQLVSGTTLLIELVPAGLRHRGEALGEIAMGSAAAVSALTAGPLLAVAGGTGLGMAAALLSTITVLTLWWSRRPAPAGPLAPASLGHAETKR
jgi:MFS family permease